MISATNALWKQFENLTSSQDASAVSAVRCGASQQHLLIKGKFGEPVLLLATELRNSPRAPIRLKHLAVAFDARYEITNIETGTVTTATFCKFSSEPQSTSLHQYFVELLAAIAAIHERTLTQEAIDGIVDAVLELFRKLALPATKTVTGLWGELLLIHSATNCALFLDAWHIASTDTFDFSFSDARLEVKATERRIREHEFALAQVRGGRAGDVVASVFLSRSSAGKSALDLTREIATRLPTGQREKLWAQVLEALGTDAEASIEQRFDANSALDSLRFIPALSVPAPQIADDDSTLIVDVRFRANISRPCVDNAIDCALFLSRNCQSSALWPSLVVDPAYSADN